MTESVNFPKILFFRFCCFDDVAVAKAATSATQRNIKRRVSQTTILDTAGNGSRVKNMEQNEDDSSGSNAEAKQYLLLPAKPRPENKKAQSPKNVPEPPSSWHYFDVSWMGSKQVCP
jgi:hypothetical protein